MTRLLALGLCLLGTATSMAYAQGKPPTAQEIVRRVVDAASKYADGIACREGKIDVKDVFALTPYKSRDDRWEARYAVLWFGDVGCAGGSGTSHTHLAMVSFGMNDYAHVLPGLSSPQINFDSPVRFIERVVSHTRDTLVMEGMEAGASDPGCCPSIPVRFTLRVDKQGHWKMVERRELPRKK